MSRIVWMLAIPCLFAASAFGQAQPAAPPAALDVPALVAKVEPAVACILVSRSPAYRKLGLVTGLEPPGKLGDVPDFQFRLRNGGPTPLEQRQLQLHDPHHIPEAFGTGLIIDSKGLVLTNYHVIRDAVKVFVRWPEGKGSYADILAADPRSDLAVLKLLTPGGPLPTIRFGDGDKMRRGETVIALSNPYVAGFSDGHASVSVGVVSNLRRRIPGREQTMESSANPLYQFGLLMQTDARLALGSSGGALLDAKGECVGITTALAALAGSDVPGGFAVPVNARIRKIIDVLRRGEEVDYGFLGVSLNRDAQSNGVQVSTVAVDSPASAAAMIPSDIIVEIDGIPIKDNQDLFLAISACQAGDTAKITVQRRGTSGVLETKRLEATLVKSRNGIQPPIASSLGKRPYVGGLRVDYTSLIYGLGDKRIKEGVLIVDVKKDSKAAKLGLFEQDIITQVNDRKVNTPESFYGELSRARGPIVLVVERDDKTITKNWQ